MGHGYLLSVQKGLQMRFVNVLRDTNSKEVVKIHVSSQSGMKSNYLNKTQWYLTLQISA